MRLKTKLCHLVMMKIYFMGIGGSAMGNAALLARAAGHDVIGSDAGVYPPMSTVLAEAGIRVHEGYDVERLAQLAPDLVVIGNAMSRGHVEVEWLLETRALEFTSLPAFLSGFVLKGRRNIVIAGTHGKTTTTALTAHLLRSPGRDPGYLIGGVPLDPPTGNHLGAGTDPSVIENSAGYRFAHFSLGPGQYCLALPSIAAMPGIRAARLHECRKEAPGQVRS